MPPDNTDISQLKGLWVQHNSWTCGAYALRHAVLLYGQRVNVRMIARTARASRKDGISTEQLKSAAQKLGYQMMPRRYFNHSSARQSILRYLRKGIPVIICIDGWTHWVVIAKHQGRKFIVLDSSRPGPVIKRYKWAKLRELLVFRDDECREPERYDFYPIKPIGEQVTRVMVDDVIQVPINIAS